jgi:hypothetical protein
MLFSLIEETHQHAGSDVVLLCNFFLSFPLHPSSSSFCVSKGSRQSAPIQRVALRRVRAMKLSPRAPERKERREKEKRDTFFVVDKCISGCK